MAPRMIEVGPRFPYHRLPPGIECYYRLQERMVVVRGPGLPFLVFYRSGRLICDCPEAQMNSGECQHTRALRAGLWAHVFMCPQGRGIVTRTREWLQGMDYLPILHWRVAPEASVTVC